MQMKFAYAQYCDFLVWRKDDFIVDRILPDVSFIDDALAKANIFVKTALLPELIGRWFTKQQTTSVPPANQTILNHGSTSAMVWLMLLVQMITLFFGVTAKEMIPQVT